jgi:hypothetical protein
MFPVFYGLGYEQDKLIKKIKKIFK